MELLSPVDRLWDLRRGDADDDRTSPHGRGWWSMVAAAALEFNYVAASISFVLLVIAPALLVGLVPPLVASYGFRALDPATLARQHPGVSLLMLALLVAVVARFGRPLLSLISSNVWHLHYTLIVPLFVALRELISAGIERLPGQSNAPEQLDLRRRLGTSIAALLLAGGGLALAATLEFSSGTRLVQSVDGWSWTMVWAALRNAGIILGISTAFASLYWLWRELVSDRPLRSGLQSAPRSDATAPVVRIAHLSDLHMVGEQYGFRMEAGKAGPRGNERVARALREVVAIHASRPLDSIVVTGDITDAGARAEWLEFMDAMKEFPSLRERLLFVPGNHDVNVIDRTNPARLDLPRSTSQALRKLRVVLALDEIQGERVRVVDRTTGTLGASLSAYLRQGERPELLRALAERGRRRGRREIARVWQSIFPLVAPPPANGGYGLILLDSNALRYFSLTNAIGVIGRSQLRALRSILRYSRDRAWIIALHHHVVEYPIPSIGLRERIGLALVNAPDVLDAIAAHGSSVVMLHGHRHREWVGSSGDIVLCSAPSATLGSYDIDTKCGSFHVYELASGGDGALHLTTVERVTVP